MKLRGTKLQVLLAVGIILPGVAHAERYLIQFQSEKTFATYSSQVASQKSLLNQFSSGPIRSGVQFMNSTAQVTEALNALQMVIVEAEDGVDLSLLQGNPHIRFIEKEVMIPAPQPVNSYGVYAVGAAKASLADFNAPWGLEAVKAEQAWNVNGKGDGARVMVLDTGVDRDHPALANQFVEAQDFTGSSGLPYDYFDEVGHGTHVAGTILGENVGVAPEAELFVGKVCSTQGCPSFAIAQGVNWAIEQKVDVVNMSLGGPFPSNAYVYEAAEKADVLIVAASGNDGKNGISYPAGHPTTFAVGAINQNFEKADFSQWGKGLDVVAPGTEVLSAVPQGTGQTSEASINLGKGLEAVASAPMDGSAVTETTISGDVVYAGLGKPEDFQKANVRGKIALIQRGEIAFGDKAKAAFNAGAIGVIIFNNKEGLDRGTLNVSMTIPVVMIDQASGNAIVDASSKAEVDASIGVLASDYAELQGTSMASPHVAGVAALVRAANRDLTAAEVRELLRSTAVPLTGDNSENQWGSGLIDAERAVEAAVSGSINKVAVGQ
jgi:serine protease